MNYGVAWARGSNRMHMERGALRRHGCAHKISFGLNSLRIHVCLPTVRRLVNDRHSRKGCCEEDDTVQCHDYDSCGGHRITQL